MDAWCLSSQQGNASSTAAINSPGEHCNPLSANSFAHPYEGMGGMAPDALTSVDVSVRGLPQAVHVLCRLEY